MITFTVGVVGFALSLFASAAIGCLVAVDGRTRREADERCRAFVCDLIVARTKVRS